MEERQVMVVLCWGEWSVPLYLSPHLPLPFGLLLFLLFAHSLSSSPFPLPLATIHNTHSCIDISLVRPLL